MQEQARRRLAVVAALLTCACVLVGVRLVTIGLLEHERWTEFADRQQLRSVPLDPERGALLDREGRELAVSVPAWSAFANPSLFPDESARLEAARRLAPALGLSEAAVGRRLQRRSHFTWLRRKLGPEQRDAVAAVGVEGVGFVEESRRSYPNGELAAHVLGLVGTDNQGLEGLEFQLDRIVAGRPGRLLTMKDARGAEFLPEGLSCLPPARGADVVLTLDAVIQHFAERELRNALERTGARAGSVIVMFPGNGDVAALSNLPTFNPNNEPTYPSHLRTNRAVASCYEPGSTFKMFTAAAALESGRARPDELVDCGRGRIRVGGAVIRDHHPFDRLTVEQVLAKSSNVGTVRLAQRVGADELHATLVRLGFGRRTGLGFPGESAGILRGLDEWSPRSLASVSFGQEVAVSALQLTAAACAVANGGLLPPPRLVREVRRADGRVERPARQPAERVLSERTARSLSLMLESVVVDGTARRAAVPGYRVAGKTGTAQKIGDDGTYLDDRHVASFVGWAPARQPAFVALVVLDEPRSPYYGGTAAAPVFAALARDVLRYLEIPPESPSGELPGGVSAL
jgi:cell division protein FtsI (penicillin-binding protein 3)